MIKTKTWIVLIGIVLAASAVGAILIRSGGSGPAATAKVYLNNQCIHTVDLSTVTEGYTLPVTGEAGTNIISVEPGRICVAEADCPDQVCVNQGWQSDGITPIVCLPNKLVIQFETNAASADAAGLDGVIQ